MYKPLLLVDVWTRVVHFISRKITWDEVTKHLHISGSLHIARFNYTNLNLQITRGVAKLTTNSTTSSQKKTLMSPDLLKSPQPQSTCTRSTKIPEGFVNFLPQDVFFFPRDFGIKTFGWVWTHREVIGRLINPPRE